MPAALLAGEAAKIATQVLGSAAQKVIGAVQLIKAGKQQKQAEKIQANTVEPTYQVQQQYIDNYNLAANRAAQGGLSDAAMVTYQNNMDRGLTASYDALLRGGADINAISEIYDNYADRADQLTLLDEEIRRKETQQFMLASERVAEERDKQFQMNEYRPYMNRVRAAEALANSANQNRSMGLNSIAASFLNDKTGDMFKKEIAGIFGGAPANGQQQQRTGPYTGAIMNRTNTGGVPPLATPPYFGNGDFTIPDGTHYMFPTDMFPNP